MNLDAALQTFLQEARELLQEMENAALRLEENPADTEAVNAMFRPAHTIKGSSGLFGLDPIVAFTHVVENVLDRVRGGDVPVTSPLMAALLKCCDHIGKLVDCAASGVFPPALVAAGKELHDQLGAAAGAAPPKADKAAAAPDKAAAKAGPEGDPVENANWHISLRFDPEVLRKGMDPMSFLTYLKQYGDLVRVVVLDGEMPAAAEMDPERCYLGFEIALRSQADKAALESVFEFVRDDCTLHMLPPRAALKRYIELIEDLPGEPMRLGDILVSCGALTPTELSRGLARQAGSVPPRPPVGQILVEQRAAPPEVVDAALNKQRESQERRAQESRSIRIDADKLDVLIDLVGELVVSGARATMLTRSCNSSEMTEAMEAVARFTDQIRDSAMRLRMVQIGETFNRFKRVVRDVSRDLGKDIELVITGAETELDKVIVEKLTDPLTHLVRNSLDHGIEPGAVRRERGKVERGKLHLHAYHDSGSVVIEVRDDGGGLNRERILRRARERGLVGEHETPKDSEICQMIFRAGFSTAEKVTDLSGRGVGMDVVKRNIDALRGTIEIDSIEGRGTTIRIRLPLTLAIIDGFLVKVAEVSYVVPLDTVVECVSMTGKERGGNGGRNYINLRGELLSFVVLRELFGRAGGKPEPEMLVVQSAGRKAGLLVDQLVGEIQTVIKPAGKLFHNLPWLAGTTLLGTGEVALILDVQSLVQHTTQHEVQVHAPVIRGLTAASAAAAP